MANEHTRERRRPGRRPGRRRLLGVADRDAGRAARRAGLGRAVRRLHGVLHVVAVRPHRARRDRHARPHPAPSCCSPRRGCRVATCVLGYDERGHCPMLVDGACSIYEHRPRTCRTYDCRVFPAAGVEPDADKAPSPTRARRWRFTDPTRPTAPTTTRCAPPPRTYATSRRPAGGAPPEDRDAARGARRRTARPVPAGRARPRRGPLPSWRAEARWDEQRRHLHAGRSAAGQRARHRDVAVRDRSRLVGAGWNPRVELQEDRGAHCRLRFAAGVLPGVATPTRVPAVRQPPCVGRRDRARSHRRAPRGDDDVVGRSRDRRSRDPRIIRRFPQVELAAPAAFAPCGVLELILHTYDIANGSRRSLRATARCSARGLFAATDAWPRGDRSDRRQLVDLLASRGRPRPER